MAKEYFLCAEGDFSKCVVFSASFADIAKISFCFVLAHSLAEAVSVIYKELGKEYPLDSVLLSVEFYDC